MKKLLTILLFSLISMGLWSQEWVWGLKAKGDIQHSEDTDMAVDRDGNIVLAGYYQRSLRLDTCEIFTEDDFYSDIYLCLIDTSKEVKWLRHIETGITYDRGIGVTMDDDNFIYLTGAKDGHIFAAKFNLAGEELWVCDFDCAYYGYGTDVAIDQSDQVYISANNLGNTFLAKLNFDGEPVWVKQFEGGFTTASLGNDLAIDRLGTVYMAGVFECDSLMLDNCKIRNESEWGTQSYLCRISSDGDVVWARTPTGRTNDFPQTALTSEGVLLAAVVIEDEMSFGKTIIRKTTGGNDGSPFLAMYDFEGKLQWARVINTYGGEGTPRDLVTDLDGNIYLTGQAFCKLEGTEMDLHVEKYDPEGNLLWNKVSKTNTGEYSHAVGIDAHGNLYHAGYSDNQGFVLEDSYKPPFSVGVAKMNTASETRRRPLRPKGERLSIVCPGERCGELRVSGENITWYDDAQLQQPVNKGAVFTPDLSASDTFYVCQSVGGVRSWPRELIVHFSALEDTRLIARNDTLEVLGGAYLSYQWYLNDLPVYGATGSTILADSIGTYSVELQEGICSASLDTTLFPDAIIPMLSETDMRIYPNPTRDGVTNILVRNEIAGDATVMLMSVSGQVLEQRDVRFHDGRAYIVMSLEAYPPGMYLVQILGEGLSAGRRILRY